MTLAAKPTSDEPEGLSGPRWARLGPKQAVRAALAVALVGGAALLYHLIRGTTFWFDEWLWITERRGNDVGTFLHPYNDHLSLVPIAIYRVLFATAGIHTYVPYRLMVIAGHLACVLLVYVYASRRVGGYLALLGSLLILFFGPAWQEFLWPFQIAWLITIAAGIGAFLMLDRRNTFGDVAACVLLIVSLASSSVGVAFALGAVVDVAWGRRRWANAWIVVVPLALYGLWSLVYQNANVMVSDVYYVEQFVTTAAAASLSSLLGVAGQTPGQDVALGAPLALAGVGLLAWLAYRRRWSARAASLATGVAAFWLLTAIGRAFIGGADASRYLYVDGVFLVLLAAELARGRRLKPWVGVAFTVVTAAAIVSNIGIMRSEAFLLRAAAARAKAELAALNLSHPVIGPTYIAASFPGYPFVVVQAGPLFAAERSLGSPAYSLSQLATAPDDARQVADQELMRAEQIQLGSGAATAPAGPSPTVENATSATATASASCVSFQAGPARPTQSSRLQLTIPPTGVWLLGSGAQATVAMRRFGTAFQPLGTLPAGVPATVRIRPDGAAAPWHLQLITAGRATVCGLPA
jgi:hypothetical protein